MLPDIKWVSSGNTTHRSLSILQKIVEWSNGSVGKTTNRRKAVKSKWQDLGSNSSPTTYCLYPCYRVLRIIVILGLCTRVKLPLKSWTKSQSILSTCEKVTPSEATWVWWQSLGALWSGCHAEDEKWMHWS